MSDMVIVAIVGAIPATLGALVGVHAAVNTLRGNRTLGAVKVAVNGTARAARTEIKALKTKVAALEAEIARLYTVQPKRTTR